MLKRERRDRSAASHGSYAASISIDTYIEIVNKCAQYRLNYSIANGSPFHARILIGKLFEVAEKEVQIITGALRAATSTGIDIYGYGNVINAAKNFLTDPSSKLSIIFQTGQIDRKRAGNPFLTSIIDDKNRNGVIELITPMDGVLDAEVPHFMVSDASAFRLETGEDATYNHEGVRAFANFGDDATAVDLSNYYYELSNVLIEDNLAESEVIPPIATA